MELDHFSHRHPLKLNRVLQVNGGAPVICSGCEEVVSGSNYSCNACNFILHKKCAELPWEIKSHLHSKHPLALLAKPSAHPLGRCFCALCRKICKSFVYNCSICDFDLDIQCVFAPRIFDTYTSYRDEEIKHFSHPHPLFFTKDQRNATERVVCYACEENVLGPRYSCMRCNYILHVKCAELPLEMICHLHPQHPLVLLAKPPAHYPGTCICDLCRRSCRSFVYHCSHCNFDADIRCAFPFTFEANSSHREVKIEHFSHTHPLILNEEHGQQVVCSGCEEYILGPSYSCNPCSFVIHKKCAELPRKINCNLHRQHPLALLARPPPHYSKCVCDLCYKTCRSFVYHCSLCGFDLDVKCAFPPCLSEVENRGHQFIGLLKSSTLKSFSFTCNACGTEGDACPYMCSKCQLMVHGRCISLPQVINSSLHQHPISHTYFLVDDGNSNCGICQSKVKTDYGGYTCRDCKFIAHVNCIRRNNVRSIVQVERPRVTLNENSIESATNNVAEIRLGENTRAAEIKHFSHHHDLILFDKANNDKRCNSCILPISSSFYGCTECDFFLDTSCIELPSQKMFLNGGLALFLSSRAPTVDGVYRCNACKQYCNGFIYKSDEINVNFDVKCSNLVLNSVKHEGHEHPLFFSPKSDDRRCNACNEIGWPFLFSCTVCNFNLDFRCASLPLKYKHRYDRHPLLLTYHPVDDGSGEFCCDICQSERDQNLWFYNCSECNFAAHPKCILGKNSLVKLGGTCTYDIHPHQLTLVQKRGKFPPCHACAMPCDDLALECTIPQCDFIIHRKKDHCFSRILGTN